MESRERTIGQLLALFQSERLAQLRRSHENFVYRRTDVELARAIKNPLLASLSDEVNIDYPTFHTTAEWRRTCGTCSRWQERRLSPWSALHVRPEASGVI